jgi:predicted Zn finger-like uncharacterized protein
MLIVCSKCATSYRVDASALGAAGRPVRCVRCRNVKFAWHPGALSAIAQAYRTEVEAIGASLSVSQLADSPPEAPVTPLPASATDEPPAQPTIEAEPAPSDTVRETPTVQIPPPRAAELLDPLRPQEPIWIADAAALAPMEHGVALPTDARLRERTETFAAYRPPRRTSRRSQWSLPVLPIAIPALVALNAALIGWRTDVVKVLPQTASLYAAIDMPVNLRGLSFANVRTVTETQDGMQVLVVEGTIASASARVVKVPRLRFSIRNGSGQEVYAWTALPGSSVLAPGETLAFHSRLASPPPDARDVLVRFLNHRDLVADIQFPAASSTHTASLKGLFALAPMHEP